MTYNSLSIFFHSYDVNALKRVDSGQTKSIHYSKIISSELEKDYKSIAFGFIHTALPFRPDFTDMRSHTHSNV